MRVVSLIASSTEIVCALGLEETLVGRSHERDYPPSVTHPDVLLILPCGFDLTRTRNELPILAKRPEWQQLKAVRMGNVFLLDGSQYFNRPGPRLVESLEILAEILHPNTFRFGHEGSGWQRIRRPESRPERRD
jgi:ABC-type Fe3+-hydroxamate transport system substrate-binding protein